VDHARDRITIVAGGGVRENNVREVIERTSVKELHSRFIDEAGMQRLVEKIRYPVPSTRYPVPGARYP
jgi:copper homeostasis protein CutC